MLEMIRRDPVKCFFCGIVGGLGIAVGICFAEAVGRSMRGLDGSVAFSLATDFLIMMILTAGLALLVGSKNTSDKPTEEK